MNRAHLWKTSEDLTRGVSRAIVNYDHFVIRVFEHRQRLEALVQRGRTVVRTNHHRDARRLRKQFDLGAFEDLTHGMKGGFGRAVGIGDAKGPVFDRSEEQTSEL